MAPLLYEVGYPTPILAILEDAVVSHLHITDYQ
jgi:hypothetical protein